MHSEEPPQPTGTFVAVFEEQRGRMFGLAYRLLGSAAEAEDVVQDAFLRWREADHTAIRVPGAWLAKVVTNLCLNRLSSARTQREQYVGPWLPEPVLTENGALGPLETAEQRESVSMGLLVLLERLTPPERAAFILREAFGYTHRDIAESLDVSEAHARQLYRRARDHIGEERERFTPEDAQHRRIVERFFDAAMRGEVDQLERMLAEDVVSWADGGGRAGAARHPIRGRERVLRYLAGLSKRPEAARLRSQVMEVNGAPAVLAYLDGGLTAVIVPQISDGRITSMYVPANPEKLTHLARQVG